MSDLHELVLRRLAELGEPGSPMSVRRAADRSRGRITYETLRVIARGEHSGKLTDKVAEGLAMALDVPLQQVYDAARVPRPQSRWVMPERFDRLDPPQRRLVEDFAAGLLEAYDKGLRDARQGL
jgi:hypothetical protein